MILTIENTGIRAQEIENIFLPSIHMDHDTFRGNLSQVLQKQDKFEELCMYIEHLGCLVGRVKADLLKLEQQVKTADIELNVPEKESNFIFKTLKVFASNPIQSTTNLDKNGDYKSPDIFIVENYVNKV